MVMPCSRSARRPSVSRATSNSPPRNPRSALVAVTASSWSARIAFASWSSRPTRVDLPSSTDPAVAKRSSVFVCVGDSPGVARWSVVVSSSEVPVLLSVFHGRGRDPVVGTCGSAFGHGGRGHLGEDRVDIGRLRVDGAGAGHIADGAVAHGPSDHGLVLARGGELAGGPPHAVAVEHLAFVGEVEL